MAGQLTMPFLAPGPQDADPGYDDLGYLEPSEPEPVKGAS
jgi:hypothetical protein